MRILHVDPAMGWRGGERQVLLLARELARRGHHAPVACAPGGALFRRAREAGLPTEPFRARGDLDLGAALRVARLLRRHRPHVLHLHTARAHAAGGLGARLAGYRPVLVTRRLELRPRGGVLGRWKYRRLADHYVAISGAVEDSLVRAGLPPDRVERIPSGVEIPPARRRAPRGTTWTVGTLAAFTPQKDPDTWLAAAARVCTEEPAARFVWAGGGELASSFPARVEAVGLAGRVELPGFLEDPEPLWERIDAFFLPSAFEALGTVLLDAMARGIPVVATAVGGVPEVVRDGREGLLAPRGDAEALARALVRLRRDPALADRLAAAGRERARAFEIGAVVDRVVALYERLTAREGTAE